MMMMMMMMISNNGGMILKFSEKQSLYYSTNAQRKIRRVN